MTEQEYRLLEGKVKKYEYLRDQIKALSDTANALEITGEFKICTGDHFNTTIYSDDIPDFKMKELRDILDAGILKANAELEKLSVLG